MLKRRLWNANLLIGVIVTTAIIILLIILNSQKHISHSKIYISEVCVRNKECAYDEYGRYGGDYVELYNDSDEAVNIQGYGLSDDIRKPYRYRFGDVSIEPHDTLMVWFNEDPIDSRDYREDYNPKDVHGAHFGLKENELIILTDNNRIKIQELKILPTVPEGMVMACTKENFQEFDIADPSPYRVEEKHNISQPGLDTDSDVDLVDKPTFSCEGGWYDDKITVELNSNGGEIFYTTDGTNPTKESKRYVGPIEISDRSNEKNLYAAISGISYLNDYIPDSNVDKGTVIKAICIKDGKTSKVAAETYFIGLDKKVGYEGISIMEITFSPDDLFDYERGIYVLGKVFDNYIDKLNDNAKEAIDPYKVFANYSSSGKGWERPVTIDYYDSNHNKLLSQNVGIRMHGWASRALNQKSFNLYAREEYDGTDSFDYDFFGHSLNKIMLRNGGYNDGYATKMRDVFNQSLVEDRDFLTQSGEPCAVFLNGEYWGLYNLQETVNTRYQKEYYDVEEDNVLLMKDNEAKSNEEYAYLYDEVVSYAVSHNMASNKYYKEVENMIDIQSYIDYYSFIIYIAASDTITNNFGRWRTIKNDGSPYGDCKWRWMSYDTDDAVGMITVYNMSDVDSFIEGHVEHHPMGPYGDDLFCSLLENAEFKERFVTSFLDMANKNFQYTDVKEKLYSMAQQYKDAVIKSQQRFRGDFDIPYYDYDSFDGYYDDREFNNDIQVIDDFYKTRYEYITSYMKRDFALSGNLYELSVEMDANTNCIVEVNTTSISSDWSGKYFSDYPVTIKCITGEDKKFAGWKDENGDIVTLNNEYTFYLNEDIKLSPIFS